MDAASLQFTRASLQTAPQDVILLIARYLNRLELLAFSQSCKVALHTSRQFLTYWKHDLVPVFFPENGSSSDINAHDFRLAALRSSRLKARLQLQDNKPTKVVQFPAPYDARCYVAFRTRFLFIFPQSGYTVDCYDMWTGKSVGHWTSPDLNKWGPPASLHQVASLCVSINEIMLAIAYGVKSVVYRLRVFITPQEDAFHAEFHPEPPKALGSEIGSVKHVRFGEGFLALFLDGDRTTRIWLWEKNGEGDIPLLLELRESYIHRVRLVSGKLLMYQTRCDQGTHPTHITLHAFSLHKISDLFSRQRNGTNITELPARGTQLCAVSEFGYGQLNPAKSSLEESYSLEPWIELNVPEVPNTIRYTMCTIEEDEEDSLAYKVTVKRETATAEIPIDPSLSIQGIASVYWGIVNTRWMQWSEENLEYEYKSLKYNYMDPLKYPMFNSESGYVAGFNSDYTSIVVTWIS